MNAAGPERHWTWGSVQWCVAWTVLVDALLARFLPDASLAACLLLSAGIGALAGASPVRFSGSWSGVRRWAAGAAWLAVAVCFVLRPLAGRVGGEGPSALWLPPWAVLVGLLLADLPTVRRLARLVGVEWSKLGHNRIFWAGLASTVLATLAVAVAWTPDEPTETGWTLAADALSNGQWIAEIFLLVLGATAIAGEATGGTLKMLLPHAYRRSDWLGAKALTLGLAALGFALLVGGVAVGYAALTEGLGPVQEASTPGFDEPAIEFESAAAMGGHLADTLVAGVVTMAATACLGLLFSSIFDGVVAALCFAFLVFAGLRFGDVLLGWSSETMLAIWAAWPAGEMRSALAGLGAALNTAWWEESWISDALGLSLLSVAATLLVATAVFSRRDIHA